MFCIIQSLLILWEMYIFYGIAQFAQIIFFKYLIRNRIIYLFRKHIYCLFDSKLYLLCRKIGSLRIYRMYAHIRYIKN